MMGSSLFHHLLRFFKGFHINDLEVCQYFRLTFSISDHPGINGIFNDAVDSGGRNIAALSVRNSLLGKIPAKALCPISLIEIFLKNQFHDLCLVRLHNEIAHILVSLICASLMFQTVAKGNAAASKISLLGQLLHPGFSTYRSLDAFPGGLPIAYVVQQLIDMGIKPLLSLLGAPDLDTVFDKPFYNEWRFVLSASQAVKHEHQQHIEFVLQGVPLDFLNSVPILG